MSTPFRLTTSQAIEIEYETETWHGMQRRHWAFVDRQAAAARERRAAMRVRGFGRGAHPRPLPPHEPGSSAGRAERGQASCPALPSRVAVTGGLLWLTLWLALGATVRLVGGLT